MYYNIYKNKSMEIIMISKIYSIEELTKILKPLFRKYNIEKAILFGSYAKHKQEQKSDIDLVVYSNLKGLKFIGLIEEVREITNKDIDMLDISHINKNSKIEDEIEKAGIVIYEK